MEGLSEWLARNWADALAIVVAAAALVLSIVSARRNAKDWKGRLLLQIRSDYGDSAMANALEAIARWRDDVFMHGREFWDAADDQETTFWDAPDEPSIHLDRARRKVRGFFETVHELWSRGYLPDELFEVVKRSAGAELLPTVYELEAAKRSASADRLRDLQTMISAYGHDIYSQPPHRARKFGQ